MADPYYRYTSAAGAADKGNVSKSSFPGYLYSEAPSFTSYHADMQVVSSDINQLQPGRYGMDDISNSGLYPESNAGSVPAGVTRRAYPSSLGDPNLIAQRWDAPAGVSSSMGVHPEPSFGGASAATPVRGYSSASEVPSLVGHRRDAPGISPSDGVHPESHPGAVSAAATINRYSSASEVPKLVGQRRDVPVGISLSAGIKPEPSSGALSAGDSINGNSSTPEDPHLVGQRRDAPLNIGPIAELPPEPNLGAISAGAIIKGYSSLVEGPKLEGQSQDGPLGIRDGIPAAVDEKPASTRNGDGLLAAAEESNILFVDGLPTDCSRREVGNLFRRFLGYKDIKVVHKELRHSGDRATVLCFVEFSEPKFAMTAMQTLQGYKFDDKKPNSPVLRIQFAHFPFRIRDGKKV